MPASGIPGSWRPFRISAWSPGGGHDGAGGRFVNGPAEAGNQSAAPVQRDRFIPLRKSDIIDGLIAEGRLDAAGQARLRQLARMLGAIFHYQYFEELDRLREVYFYFDPERDPKACGFQACGPAKDLEAAYQNLSEEFFRVLKDANFIEIPHDEITRAFAERARVRVKIKAPVEDYRCVRMFRRGHHTETIEIPVWFGLRRRPLEVVVYDDVVMMVATKPDGATRADARKAVVSARRGGQKIRGGAVLFKYFRHIARADLKALFPNVRVVMSLSDHLTLGVGVLVGGVPILIKLASSLIVLFVVAGFYLGLTGTIHDNDTEQALAALSGLLALGAFVLRQWGNFHRQSLMHQKQLTDNIYYRNVNNNSGIFNYLIGEAEEQDWKEALLAYYGLLTADAPLAREALGSSSCWRACSAFQPTSRSTTRWRGCSASIFSARPTVACRCCRLPTRWRGSTRNGTIFLRRPRASPRAKAW
jgi:hypothetical protein